MGQLEIFYVNVGVLKVYGIEFSGVFQFEMFDWELYFNVNVFYKKVILVDGFGSNFVGSQLLDSFEWFVIGGVIYELIEWLVVNFLVKYIDIWYIDFNEIYELKSYLVVQVYVDIGGFNSFGMFENMCLCFNVDNVFDKQVMLFGFIGLLFGWLLSLCIFQVMLMVDF